MPKNNFFPGKTFDRDPDPDPDDIRFEEPDKKQTEFPKP